MNCLKNNVLKSATILSILLLIMCLAACFKSNPYICVVLVLCVAWNTLFVKVNGWNWMRKGGKKWKKSKKRVSF